MPPPAEPAARASPKVHDKFPDPLPRPETVPTEPSLDLSKVSVLDLVNELRQRKEVPVGAMQPGQWFTWGGPDGKTCVGVKIKGGLDACSTTVAYFMRAGVACRERIEISTMSMAHRIPPPNGMSSALGPGGEVRPHVAKPKVTVAAAAETGEKAAARSAPPIRVASDRQMVGHPTTGVVRWMGANGWPLERARACLQRHGQDFPDSRIKLHLTAGKDGERGGPAALTAEQVKRLES
jgi:hypothetical protein